MKPCLSYEHFEILARILEETSENPADEDGWTPLHLAAYRGQVDLCQKIIEEINYTHRPSNNDIWSPLQWACLKGHIEVVNLILDKTTIPVNGFWIDKELNTILHFAIEIENVKIVSMLLQKIDEPWERVTNGKGMSPFHLAMAKLRENTNLASLEICQHLWNKMDQQNQFHMLDMKHWDGESQKNLKQDLLENPTKFNPKKDLARRAFLAKLYVSLQSGFQTASCPIHPMSPDLSYSASNLKICICIENQPWIITQAFSSPEGQMH